MTKDVQEKYSADFVGPVGRHDNSESDLNKCGKPRDKATLEQQIMDGGIAKNDAEWWAKEEIELLRKIEDAARIVTDECSGNAPSLGSLAILADALHNAWRRR